MSEIETFADDLLFRMLASCSELAAELGQREVSGRRLPLASAPDFSDATSAARGAMMDDALARLSRLSPPRSDSDEITARVLAYLLGEGMFGPFAGVQGRPFAAIPYPINHLSGHHPTTVMMLARDAPAASAADAEACLEVLEACSGAVVAALEAFRAREAQGVTAPRSTLERSLVDLTAFIAAPPADNVVVSAYARKLADSLGTAAAAAWSERAGDILTAKVLPAYDRQAGALRDTLDRPRNDDGFWRHPAGEAHYAWLLKAHTTTDLTPREAHELGREETARVQAEIRREFTRMGQKSDDIGELYATISGAEHRAFEPGPVTRDKALADTRTLIAAFQRIAAPMFLSWPKAAVEVELIADEFEDSQHSCYTPPMSGGGRSGLFSLNFKDSAARPAWELPVLCAHEAAPGHHVQLALAQELPLCAFRRAVVFTAYVEGWAKYAETLLDDVLSGDPCVRLGRLRGELYSSVNLALDTGLHALRWSREEAIAHFRENTGAGDDFATTIVDRSLVSPGQLCAYKTGMLEFVKLRDRFAVVFGADRRSFHAAVLGQGALPLSLMVETAGAGLAAAKRSLRAHASGSAG